jgi:hypothetical protein
MESMPHPSLFLKIHLNIILPSFPGSSKFFLPQVSPPKPCTHFSTLIRATCPTPPILLDLNWFIIPWKPEMTFGTTSKKFIVIWRVWWDRIFMQ